jgi:hypothetical protein
LTGLASDQEPPTYASHIVGIMGVRHCTWFSSLFLLLGIKLYLPKHFKVLTPSISECQNVSLFGNR